MTGPGQRRAHHLKNLPAYTAYLTGAIPDQFWESMAFLCFLPFLLMADELTLVWNDIRSAAIGWKDVYKNSGRVANGV